MSAKLHELLLAGRVDDALGFMAHSIADVGVTLPRTRRAATSSLARARTVLRLRGYRIAATHGASADSRAPLERLFEASIALSLVDGLRAATVHTRYLLLALKLGDISHAARGLALEAVFLASFGEAARRRAEVVVKLAAAAASDADDTVARALVCTARGAVADSAGDFSAADESWRRALDELPDQSTAHLAAIRVRQLQRDARVYLGRLGDVRAEIDAATDASDHYTTASRGIGLSNLTWLARDDVSGARASVQHAERAVMHAQELCLAAPLAQAQIDLYSGDGAAAWQRVNRAWPVLAETRLLRTQRLRIEAHHLRARCALASAQQGVRRQARLLDAEHDIAALEREHQPWATALSRLLRAALGEQRGDHASARAWLRAAERELDRGNMCLYLAAARYRAGTLADPVDAPRLERAERAMRDQGITQPARFCDVLAPGFPPSA